MHLFSPYIYKSLANFNDNTKNTTPFIALEIALNEMSELDINANTNHAIEKLDVNSESIFV